MIYLLDCSLHSAKCSTYDGPAYYDGAHTIHLFQKTLPERTVIGSCRTEIARPNGTVVSIFGMQKNEFFAWRKTDTRELKHATFLTHGRTPEVNISHARTVVSLRFSK